MSEPMSPDEIAAVEARLNAATDGPWRLSRGYDTRSIWADRDSAGWDAFHIATTDWPDDSDQPERDAEFIANAPADIAALLAHVREQAAEIERLKLEKKMVNGYADRWCEQVAELQDRLDAVTGADQ